MLASEQADVPGGRCASLSGGSKREEPQGTEVPRGGRLSPDFQVYGAFGDTGTAREVNGPVQVPHPQPTPTSFPVFSADRKHPAQPELSLESIL